ncbi:urease accessory protein UreF [Leptolyngbya sp. FACHB-261]|uniref:urease accessory protein UreF n=1 Tax=Leptolyngbya sp. FACHB-261 TaxID=2692806 RepID=UPI001688D95D|nr:urease accessory UreF family protein [Leptolyngbya sp. FACHB-261]MBD2103800.1 urease accessory protein UreF [Leptolyngbya sp. FACHB-261]
MFDPALLKLLQLSDSALPIGSYSHSWGLETWVQQGQLSSSDELLAVLRTLLEQSIAPVDGLACAMAYQASANRLGGPDFIQLNQILTATKWAKEPQRASLDLGRRLVSLAQRLDWLQELPPGQYWHHCTVFGWLTYQLNIAIEPAVTAYLLSNLMSLTSAAVRLIPLGHSQGQQVLAALHTQVFEQARWCCATAGRADPLTHLGSFTPQHELACQAHQNLYSRLFQS